MPEEIRHLRTEDRKIISRMKKDNKSQAEIARTIGFSQGTISKELARNSGKGDTDPSRRKPRLSRERNPSSPGSR